MPRELYTYWRSTAAYRVRIALNLKQLDYDCLPVDLVRDGGEHRQPAYLARNPLGLVPSFNDDGAVLNQSLAIIEYLEETQPWPPLLPADPRLRAQVRALALTIACDIHPLNNLRVLRYLSNTLSVDDAAKNAWYAHWVAQGFAAIEATLAASDSGDFCSGDSPGLADVCLIPQVYNAHRFACDMGAYPRITRINEACLALPAFDRARPENQSDAPPIL